MGQIFKLDKTKIQDGEITINLNLNINLTGLGAVGPVEVHKSILPEITNQIKKSFFEEDEKPKYIIPDFSSVLTSNMLPL